MKVASSFEFKKPNLSSFDFTDEELYAAMKYTRVRECVMEGAPDAHTAWLVVGNQSFAIGPAYETQAEADWLCWMLAKALVNAGCNTSEPSNVTQDAEPAAA